MQGSLSQETELLLTFNLHLGHWLQKSQIPYFAFPSRRPDPFIQKWVFYLVLHLFRSLYPSVLFYFCLTHVNTVHTSVLSIVVKISSLASDQIFDLEIVFNPFGALVSTYIK